MPSAPFVKNAIAFVDGQNLFYAAKEAFGHSYPNFDIVKLAGRICQARGWFPKQTRFYTGVPDAADNSFWATFWAGKLAVMGRQGVHVFSRPLRYRTRSIRLPDGSTYTFIAGEEKGIDVRIALDIIRLCRSQAYDVALVFSQDQDLTEVAEEVCLIAREQGRWVKVASAFPSSPTSRNKRGIDRTDWIRIDRSLYDACLDRRDYRPKAGSPG